MSRAENGLELCIRLRAGVRQLDTSGLIMPTSRTYDVSAANNTMKAAAALIEELMKEVPHEQS